jgi:hypothetical protein
MGYNETQEKTSELWAVLDKEGNILYSRGGSSSKPRLLIYPTEKLALRGLNNSWTKQVIDSGEVEIKCVYKK